jgi:hypothetical protein
MPGEETEKSQGTDIGSSLRFGLYTSRCSRGIEERELGAGG